MRRARKGWAEWLMLECQAGQWYALTPFLQNAKVNDPLLLRDQSRYAAYGGVRNRKDVIANWDHSDGEIITGMLASTLNELGLVTIGYQTTPSLNGDKNLNNPDAFGFTDLAAQVLCRKQPAA